MTPIALIIRAAGTNCDEELAYAFELAGAKARVVHLNKLIADPQLIDRAQLIGFPGGFSYGDDIAAGRIFAQRVGHHLLGPLRAAVERGAPVIGICNGFQVLVQCGLLPDAFAENKTETTEKEDQQPSTRPRVALGDNDHGRFLDRWVSLGVPEDSVCIWTRGLDGFELPIAHGEGRFVAGDNDVLAQLQRQNQIALRYKPPNHLSTQPPAGTDLNNSPINTGNPNGSQDDIAGICDPSGVVLGLMPHPERDTLPTHHPLWTRRSADAAMRPPVGLKIFQNAVAFACDRSAVSAARG